jgi:serine/threonine protein kinase
VGHRPGQSFERYELLRKLGAGGQGEVWEARDRSDGHLVVLKTVYATASGALERARREAAVLAALRAPELVHCERVCVDDRDGALGIVLERVDAVALDAVPPLSAHHTGWIVRHLARALAVLHGAGLVHRDVKAPNVLLTAHFFEAPHEAGTVRLIDLGIAAKQGGTRLTRQGSVIGTLSALAPEQLEVELEYAPVDPRIDVFALGVLAWTRFAGVHPSGLDPREADWVDYRDAYRAARARGVAWPAGVVQDASWRALLLACLTIAPEQRVSSALDLLARLPPAAKQDVPTSTTTAAWAPRPSGTPGPPTWGRGSGRAGRIQIAMLLGGCVLGVVAWASLRDPGVDPPPPSAESRVVVSAPAPGATTSVPPGSTSPASSQASCGGDEVGLGSACVDRRPVSLGDWRTVRPTDRDVESAYSLRPPGVNARQHEAHIEEQTRRCAARKALAAHASDVERLGRLPMGCVDFARAADYCRALNKRLPTLAELEGVRAGLEGGLPFEWTATSASANFHRTHGFAGPGSQNRNDSRNADNGFRCARDLR